MFRHLVKNPEDRRPAASELVEALRRHAEGLLVRIRRVRRAGLAELPDNVTAASLIAKIAASSAWSGGETTVLLRVEEMMETYRRAGSLEYKPAGSYHRSS